jgi:hypothetical protein
MRIARLAIVVFIWIPLVLMVTAVAYGLTHQRHRPPAVALKLSVAREVSGSTLVDLGPCRKLEGSRWRCWVSDKQGSGGTSYRVTMRGHSCWSATKVGRANPEEPMARRARGCVEADDRNLSFWSALPH